MSKAPAAAWASSKNISKKSPIRKNNSASGFSAFIANHCAMAGDAPGGTGFGFVAGWSVSIGRVMANDATRSSRDGPDRIDELPSARPNVHYATSRHQENSGGSSQWLTASSTNGRRADQVRAR